MTLPERSDCPEHGRTVPDMNLRSCSPDRCDPGTRQLHLASGEVWEVERRRGESGLIIFRGAARMPVTVEYWLGAAWVGGENAA